MAQDPDINFAIFRENTETSALHFAAFSLVFPGAQEKWVFCFGKDESGQYGTVGLKFVYGRLGSDLKHVYVSVDGQQPFSVDLLNETEVSIELEKKDRVVYEHLLKLANQCIALDPEIGNQINLSEQALVTLVNEGHNGLSYATPGFENGLIKEITHLTGFVFSAELLDEVRDDPVINYVIFRDDDETEALLFFAATVFDSDGLVKWVVFAGDDGAGGVDLGCLKYVYDESDYDLKHVYYAFAGSAEFHSDLLAGDDLSVPLSQEDQLNFRALINSMNGRVTHDEEGGRFVISDQTLQAMMEEGDDGTSYATPDFDWEFLEEITAHTPLKFKYSM